METNLYNKDKTLFEILEEGVLKIKKEYALLAKDNKVLDFPSAAASIVRLNGDLVEFYTIYDCIILVQDIFGNIFDIYDSRNAINDNIVMTSARAKATELGLTTKQVGQKYPEIISEGRQLRNTYGHQYVLADDVSAVKNGICFSMKKNLVQKIMIMSDGFSQCFDMFKFISKEKFMNKINSLKDIEKYYNKLRKHQKKDSEGQKYLRYKESDDATIVVMKF